MGKHEPQNCNWISKDDVKNLKHGGHMKRFVNTVLLFVFIPTITLTQAPEAYSNAIDCGELFCDGLETYLDISKIEPPFSIHNLEYLLFLKKLNEEFQVIQPSGVPIRTECEYKGEAIKNYDTYEPVGIGKLDQHEYACYLLFNSLKIKEIARGKKEIELTKVEIDPLDIGLYEEAWIRAVAINSDSTTISYTDGDKKNTSNNSIVINNLALEADEEEAFPEDLKISRQIVDSLMGKDNRIIRPFIVSYANNEVDNKEGYIINGDISYRLSQEQFWGKNWAIFDVALSNDIDTTKPAEENSISLNSSLTTYYYFDNHIFDTILLKGSIKYTTDRALSRDLYGGIINLGFQSSDLLRAGHYSPEGPVDDSGNLKGYQFFWQPQLQFRFDNVADPGKNKQLIESKQKGDLIRFGPRLDVSYIPYEVFPRLNFTGSYTYLVDLNNNEDVNLGEVGVDYKLSKHFSISAAYKLGENLTTGKGVNEYFVGLGMRQ